jgi:hypothetical protein
MRKLANGPNRAFSEVQMAKNKTHEEMLNSPGHKRNVNQNHVKIFPQSC